MPAYAIGYNVLQKHIIFVPLFFNVRSVNFVCFVTALRLSFDFVDYYLVLICFDNIPVL